MGKKMFANGRAITEPFVMLPRYLFDCPAYRSLRPVSRALLFEVIRRFDGSNNGYIGLGYREAGDACGINKDTAQKAFDELRGKGFLRPRRMGGFNMKDPSANRATEWRLTWFKAGNEKPTHDYKNFVQPVGALIDGPGFQALQSE